MVLNSYLKKLIHRFLIRIKCELIRDKRKRRRVRQFLLNQENFKYYKSLKWGVSYSVFDGEELLRHSILSIRDSVDYINVVYQTVSNNGKFINSHLPDYLQQLKNEGLIDEIIFFEPRLDLRAGRNELDKRNLGLEYAKKQKVDYFMTMDTDEFYLSSELEKTKEFIAKNHITRSFCPIVNYGLSPNYRHIPIGFYAVPLFSRIYHFDRLGHSQKNITLADSTRTMLPPPFHVCV